MPILPLNQTVVSTSKRILLVLVALLFAYSSYLTKTIYGYAIGLLVLASASFYKQTIVTDSGIEMHYRAFFLNYSEHWKFQDISSIHYETFKNGQQMLHFAKGPMSKQLLFEKTEAKQVLARAKLVNPKLFVKPVN